MRVWLVGMILLFGKDIYAISQVESFLEKLSIEQKNLLSEFLRATVSSYSGYVLYGDKPMALEGYAIYPFDPSFSPYPSTIAKIKGIEFWKKLNVSNKNKEFLFVIFQDRKYCHMVTINRRSFIKAVNENLSLFRYVLGPQLTAESLLDALIEAGDDFYKVLKDDNALLGILLGYGTQNSIAHARDECVIHANAYDRSEQFPLLPQTTLMKQRHFAQKSKVVPSFGFHTLEEEHAAFEGSIKISRELKEFDQMQIPYFSCCPDLPETQDLLETYAENRKNVVAALSCDDFLENTLGKLFKNSDGKIQIPTMSKIPELCVEEDRSETLSILTSWIHQLALWEGGEFLAKAYFQGVTARENLSTASPIIFDELQVWKLEEVLKYAKNLTRAERFWENLIKKGKKLTHLVDNRVLSRTLLEGSKDPLTTTGKNVSFHYSFRFQGEKKTHIGTIEKENPELFIPGVAQTLIGMKRGEVREVYIHPEYGYGEKSFFPPNLVLIAKLQLIDFEEGEREMVIQNPLYLEKRDYHKLYKQFMELKKKQFYNCGLDFWAQAKKSDFVDYKTFSRYFNGSRRNLDPIFQTVDQVCQFVNDLEYRLILRG